ncbi:dihydrolipoyl dehydrogenase [Ornithinimicrobium humiphilum]|uniref:Dihydrolipoyl dehydrogenase n=1 Tax=Ornithinimicrobium humiphilum TaxID=125288 RepID=A0A543KN18_9MICO|nr:dihydrolipoyl dehydrogenase [Ornithinimicrobium humiphilum]TQM96459.1 dihydrolipoamide dehydrogenase [Ornithinimicrobium humiphilum]
MPAEEFDIVILGAGSGGYACALRAAQLGKRVALVEKDRLGGTCLHRGCIPTKALLHTAEIADNVRESAKYGVAAALEGIDMAAVHSYKDGVVGRLYKGLQGLVKAADGITYVEGEGRLTSASTVTVGDRELKGQHVVLATGSYARTLPGVEIGGRIMTSDQALGLETVPERVIVLGGGVIGVEFASVFRSFGAEVTVVEALDRLVAAEDPAVSKTLERAFRKRKITVKAGARVASATQDDSGVRVELEGGDVLEADLLLVAVGRGPRSADLGYEEVGVTIDRGYVPTDERLRTNVEGVRAVGDLVPGPQLAHRGFAHGIFVAEDIAGLEPTPVDDTLIPKVTYCDPEIASVGLTEEQARARHGDGVTSYEYNLGGNGKSQILGTAGFVKLVRSAADGPVVGVHMVGARMGEQIGEAQLIVGWEALPEDVAQFIHAHPTQNEALGEAHLALAGKPLHAHA